jgi:hypothetical protein
LSDLIAIGYEDAEAEFQEALHGDQIAVGA